MKRTIALISIIAFIFTPACPLDWVAGRQCGIGWAAPYNAQNLRPSGGQAASAGDSQFAKELEGPAVSAAAVGGQLISSLEEARNRVLGLKTQVPGIKEDVVDWIAKLVNEIHAQLNPENRTDLKGEEVLQQAEKVVDMIIRKSIEDNKLTKDYWKQGVPEAGGLPYIEAHLQDAQEIAKELFPEGGVPLGIACLGHDIDYVLTDIYVSDDMITLAKEAWEPDAPAEIRRKYEIFKMCTHPIVCATIMQACLVAAGVDPSLAKRVYEIIEYHDVGPETDILPPITDSNDPRYMIGVVDAISLFGITLNVYFSDTGVGSKVAEESGLPEKLVRFKDDPRCIDYLRKRLDTLWPRKKYTTLRSAVDRVMEKSGVGIAGRGEPVQSAAGEILDEMDENGNRIGKSIDRDKAHKIGTPHPGSAVLVFTHDGKSVRMQKRSETKKDFPLTWTISVCGHAKFGEDPIETAVDEARHELGIELDRRRLRLIGMEDEHRGFFKKYEINDVYYYLFFSHDNNNREIAVLRGSSKKIDNITPVTEADLGLLRDMRLELNNFIGTAEEIARQFEEQFNPKLVGFNREFKTLYVYVLTEEEEKLVKEREPKILTGRDSEVAEVEFVGFEDLISNYRARPEDYTDACEPYFSDNEIIAKIQNKAGEGRMIGGGEPAQSAAAGALKFGDERVWRDEKERTEKIFKDAIEFLRIRQAQHKSSLPELFGHDKIWYKTVHLEKVLNGILKEMSGQPAEISVKDLYAVQDDRQQRRFGRIVWGKETTDLTWKELPYNVAQALIFSEVSETIGFFDEPDNPLVDFYKEERDKRQGEALFIEGSQATLPIYTRFVLGERNFDGLASIPAYEKHEVLKRALLLALKGNALDPNVLGKLKVGSVQLKDLTFDGIIVNDLDAMVSDLTSDDVKEAVIFQDNVGVELIGLALFTAAYLKMYPDKKVTWSNKQAPYLVADVTRRDIKGWGTAVIGVDGRSWFMRLRDEKYNPNHDVDVDAALRFLQDVMHDPEKFEVYTHPWTESGFLGNQIPQDLAQRIGGADKIVISVGEWLNERFANGIPYSKGTSYDTAWGYLASLGIQRFALLRMIKDAFIVVVPPGAAEGVEIVEGGHQGVVSYVNFAKMTPEARSAAGKVLILEPDYANRIAIDEVFRRSGWQTHQATDLQDAVIKFREYNLVVMEWKNLGAEPEALLRARALARSGERPNVIIYTASPQLVPNQIKNIKGVYVLEKPASAGELVWSATVMGAATGWQDLKVLVVDDDPKILKMVKRYLVEKDVKESNIVTASGRQGALNSLSAFEPDFVITDLRMPEPSEGNKLIRQIRARSQEVLPTIVLSGTPEDIEPDVKSSLLGILEKFSSAEDLYETIEIAILIKQLGLTYEQLEQVRQRAQDKTFLIIADSEQDAWTESSKIAYFDTILRNDNFTLAYTQEKLNELKGKEFDYVVNVSKPGRFNIDGLPAAKLLVITNTSDKGKLLRQLVVSL